MMKIYANEIERIIETKIKPNLKAIYNFRIKGLKDRHIAQFLGISLHQFLQALEQETTLQEAYNDATLILCSELRNVAIQRALGTDGKTDKDGNEIGPDANLAVRLLEKIDPQFSTKGEEVKVVISVEDVIHQLNEKRRMELEKKDEIIKKNEDKGLDVI
jgi:hypothetical protein